MKNPLVLFTGAALATLAALAGLHMTVLKGGLSDSQTPAEAASQATDAAALPPAQKPTDGTAAGGGTPEQPAAEAGKTPEKPTEVAAIPAQEPPKAEAPNKPELDTVRVESDGEAIVAGRAEPGAEVSLKLGEQVIGKGVANSEGAWVVVPDQPLPKGPSEITVEQKTGDSAPVAAEQSIAVAVPEKAGQQAMVALTEPGTATKVLQAGGNEEQASLTEAAPQPAAGQPAAADKTAEPAPPAQPAPETTVAKAEVPDAVTPPAASTPSPEPAPASAGEDVPLGLAAVDYNDKGDIIFSGRAKPGSAVRLYVDNGAVGDAMVDAGGNWTFAGKDIIAPGTHDLRVDQIDPAGRVIARVELPFVRENAEAVAELNAPAAPEKTEAQPEATSAQPTAQQPAQPTAQQPAQPAAGELAQPAPKAAEPPAQEVAEQPQPTTATPQQTTAEPVAAAQPQAPAPEKTAEQQPEANPAEQPKVAEAELPQASEVQKTELAAPAPSSGQPAAGDQKQETPKIASTDDATKTTGADKPRIGKIVIQPGNNLWKLSRVIYGRGRNYTVIYEANKDQIRSPRRIYPGQIFAVPGALPPEKIDPKRKEPLTSAEGGAVKE